MLAFCLCANVFAPQPFAWLLRGGDAFHPNMPAGWVFFRLDRFPLHVWLSRDFRAAVVITRVAAAA